MHRSKGSCAVALWLAVVVLLAGAPGAAAFDPGGGPTLYDRELIVNGTFEGNAGTADGTSYVLPLGWNLPGDVVGHPSVVVYGASGGFPGAADPGPAIRGTNFAAGGPNSAALGDYSASSIRQTINLVTISGDIEAQKARFRVQGCLGGFTSQGDKANIVVRWLKADGTQMGSQTLAGPTPAQRGNQTGLWCSTFEGLIPYGLLITQARVSVEFTRSGAQYSYNDGYVDNVSFKVMPRGAQDLSPADETRGSRSRSAERAGGGRCISDPH